MLFESRELLLEVVKTFKADQGLKQNIEKLNLYLQSKFSIQQQLKPNQMSRVCTYLNFPGNTEKAFNFYKSVFGTSFAGLRRS